MQIVVNTRLLIKDKLDGMGWFSYQTLKRITQNNPDVHFIFLFDRAYDEEFIFADNITPIVLKPKARHPILYYIWFQISVKKILNQLKPDLFFSPDGFLVIGAKCKQVAVIHDINFFHYPKDSKWLTSKFYNYFFPVYAKIASKILTVSTFSKKEIIEHYKIPAEKIDVVYNGINEFVKPCNASEKLETKNKYTNGSDYFLHVGSISPRKNCKKIIESFALFKQESKSKTKLVFAGASFWSLIEIKDFIKKLNIESEIIFTNRVSNNHLAMLLGSCKALLFLSYYEGFGIPLVEAMQAEVPIICSNLSALPEIAGEAALLVNPHKLEEIKNAMREIENNEELDNQLISKGKIQKENFSWDKTANLVWQALLNTSTKSK